MLAFLLFINDVHGMGLKGAEGLLLTESFCWDMDDDTRQALRRNAGQDAKRQPAGVYRPRWRISTPSPLPAAMMPKSSYRRSRHSRARIRANCATARRNLRAEMPLRKECPEYAECDASNVAHRTHPFSGGARPLGKSPPMSNSTRTYALTGSASGIGLATKLLLESRGHRVIGIDIRDADVIGQTKTS